MADLLEDENFDEKAMDQWSFKNVQLKIFKHEFREAASSANDEASKLGYKDGFDNVAKLTQKLGRLTGTLTMLKSEANNDIDRSQILLLIKQTNSLIDRLSTLEMKVEKFIEKDDQSEFDIKFVTKELPDFNEFDMNLFLGEIDLNKNGKNDIISTNIDDDLCRKNFESGLNRLKLECEDLFGKSCPVIHTFRICDGFLYD